MIKTEIWNLALVEIGCVGNIIDDSDPSPEAQACDRAWQASLDQALTLYPWGCARREAKLARRADLGSAKYKFVYQLPTDCLAVRESIPQHSEREMSGSNTLVSNEADLSVVYTARIEAQELSSHVVPVVVMILARQVATALRAGGSSLIQSLGQRGELALSNARTIENRINYARGQVPRWRDRI